MLILLVGRREKVGREKRRQGRLIAARENIYSEKYAHGKINRNFEETRCPLCQPL